MIRHCGVAIRAGIEPDFMATGGLAVELEAGQPQFPSSVSEPSKPSHSRCDDDREVSPLTRGRQTRNAVALALSVDQFPGDAAWVGGFSAVCSDAKIPSPWTVLGHITEAGAYPDGQTGDSHVMREHLTRRDEMDVLARLNAVGQTGDRPDRPRGAKTAPWDSQVSPWFAAHPHGEAF
jgi:hypothetical protein